MSKEIITLDKIDVTFQQKKRQIQAVKDVSIHINQGDYMTHEKYPQFFAEE